MLFYVITKARRIFNIIDLRFLTPYHDYGSRHFEICAIFIHK